MRRKRGQGTVTYRKDGRYEIALPMTTPSGTKERVRQYAETRSEGEAILAELLKRSNEGLLTSTKEVKLGNYLDTWLETVKVNLRPGTYESYEAIVRLYLKPSLGKKSINKLSVQDFRTHLSNQLTAGASIRLVQKQRLTLATALSQAEADDLISRNVAKAVKVPAYHPKEIVPWNANQLKIFLDCASSDPLYPVFVMLSIYGMRISEALGLSWQNIDFDTKIIHVRQQLSFHDGTFHYADLKTKAGRRDLPLLEITQAALRNVERNSEGYLADLVFKTKSGHPIHRRNVLRSFKRLARNAVLPEIALHHLRHTTATILKDIGAPDRDTQLIIGHAHISTTQQIYQHSGIAERSVILERYEQKLIGIGACSRQSQPSNDEIDFEMIKENGGSGDRVGTVYPRLMSPAL